MNYIAHRRARFHGLSGTVNLPRGTEAEEVGGYILVDGKVICTSRSQNAYDYFARNDDGKGLLRGKLTTAIKKELERRDAEYQKRWNKVWDDPLCEKYKRTEHADFWVWNFEFYHAPIFDLRHIARLVGVPNKEMKP